MKIPDDDPAPLSPVFLDADTLEVYRSMSAAFGLQRSVESVSRRFAANLDATEELRFHMLHAHDCENWDLWRNTYDEEHPLLGPSTYKDRPLSHAEIRTLHEHDHLEDQMPWDLTAEGQHRHH
jgi:hypothetical protein